MRFSPLRLSDLQWRCSICGVDYQDGATELLLLVAGPELLLPVVRPDLLLQAMPTSPLPSRSSSSSASTAGVLGGGGADGPFFEPYNHRRAEQEARLRGSSLPSSGGVKLRSGTIMLEIGPTSCCC
ncbi:uncharacterized protein [Triticum aestivum]|uniref:uncharacterized protein n=1 Tax=Triticum aestivum TaxID=4565 RepID=UPI001D02D2D8|nr:uncharacterized protein LOC123072340 [Triticum aestivum]